MNLRVFSREDHRLAGQISPHLCDGFPKSPHRHLYKSLTRMRGNQGEQIGFKRRVLGTRWGAPRKVLQLGAFAQRVEPLDLRSAATRSPCQRRAAPAAERAYRPCGPGTSSSIPLGLLLGTRPPVLPPRTRKWVYVARQASAERKHIRLTISDMHDHGLSGKARPRASPGASTHPFLGRFEAFIGFASLPPEQECATSGSCIAQPSTTPVRGMTAKTVYTYSPRTRCPLVSRLALCDVYPMPLAGSRMSCVFIYLLWQVVKWV